MPKIYLNVGLCCNFLEAFVVVVSTIMSWKFFKFWKKKSKIFFRFINLFFDFEKIYLMSYQLPDSYEIDDYGYDHGSWYWLEPRIPGLRWEAWKKNNWN